jgi:hypothetical protein
VGGRPLSQHNRGNTPGNAGGYKPRRLNVASSSDYDLLAIRAAGWSGLRCKGRCDQVGGESCHPAKRQRRRSKSTSPKTPARTPPGGQRFVDLDWRGLHGHSPLDCIGLVNRAIGCVLTKQPSLSIQQWNTGAKGMATVMSPPQEMDQARPPQRRLPEGRITEHTVPHLGRSSKSAAPAAAWSAASAGRKAGILQVRCLRSALRALGGLTRFGDTAQLLKTGPALRATVFVYGHSLPL